MILSIVAAATDGADTSRFLDAMMSEGVLASPGIEVCVVQGPGGPLSSTLSGVRLLTLGAAASIFELWGAGVRAARADAVAILDVRCPPQVGWLSAVTGALPLSTSGIFGPVVSTIARDDPDIVGYLNEYVQFSPPIDAASHEVPGVNLIALRSLLSDRRVLGEDGFVKTRFLALLAHTGAPALRMLPGAIVDYQKVYGFGAYMMHRFRHGRCYGATRPLSSLSTRLLAVLTTAILPVIRSWRIYQAARRNPENIKAVRRFWIRIGLAETAWSLGEFLGYTTGEGRARQRLR